MTSQLTITTLLPRSSSAVYIGEQGRPPVITAGKLTPDLLFDFENGAYSYFSFKEVKTEKEVSKVAGGLQDGRVQTWYRLNRAAVDAAGFPAFMKSVRENWLDPGWEQEVKLLILSSSQGTKPIADWVMLVESTNALLAGHACALSTNDLRNHIQSHIHADTMTASTTAELHLITDYEKYKRALKVVDDARIRADELLKAAVKQMMTTAIATNTSLAKRANNARSTATTSTVSATSTDNSTSRSSDRCPPLSAVERALLAEHSGCFRCRRFYAGHIGPACTNGFPDKASYRTLTEADALAAKKHNAVKKEKTTPTAALFPAAPAAAVAVVMSSAVLGNGSDSEYVDTPFFVPHFFFECLLGGPTASAEITVRALIDDGSDAVLIDPVYADRLGLTRRKLPVPKEVVMAVGNGQKEVFSFVEWVPLTIVSSDQAWTSRACRAILAPNLCVPLLLGNPFLATNGIVIDHELRTCIDKKTGYDLTNPSIIKRTTIKPRPIFGPELKKLQKAVVADIATLFPKTVEQLDAASATHRPCPIAAIRTRMEQLVTKEVLRRKDEVFKERFLDLFPPDVPDVSELPDDVLMNIKLKDEIKPMVARAYSCPKKYREGWKTLIEQHLAAGRIRPSNSEYVSPAFIVPKSDPTVLPRWVNDYRKLNLNTTADNHPLPLVDEILRDCAGHKFYGKIDMTNSFFQTRMHPDSVKYTAVNTPFGLYEWLVMPMGLRNSPAVHQRRVCSALRSLIGRICHVYLDDIIIWSETLEEHEKHIAMVLEALRVAHLYCSIKKSMLFSREVDFLGHHISDRGIEPDAKKVERIVNWPTPQSSTDVRAFLGLVRYVADFLPLLADHTRILTPLTHKSADSSFPTWEQKHQEAFDSIKRLVLSSDCLTTINHDNMGDNRIFVTCDASDWRTGAVLSYGLTWESARPVAFDSKALKEAQLNYPVHEKELLAIIHALQKWRADLLGAPITIYTDHRTLENFDHQKDLSRRQARWQEFLAQYDYNIVYIPGEDNCVADALSRLPNSVDDCVATPVASMLSIETDASLLETIRHGYTTDPFCAKLSRNETSFEGVHWDSGLLYIGDRLVIPRVGTLREDLFRLAHDNLGHFGFEKSYAALRDDYYWPNMRKDLSEAYIPACVDCLRSKDRTCKPTGPLHPLPIPDARGDSIAIDFIGPCPRDDGFDCIVTITDRLGADIRIAPTHMDISAERFAAQFFDLWYCENGLPLNIVSDRDKLFVSKFWRALTKLTGIKLKMSSAYHPETDGSSERSNKSVVQCLRYHVERNQTGWVKALPMVRFHLMNTVNTSTGFSPFQLRMGRSPRLIPPLTPNVPVDPPDDEQASAAAAALIERLHLDVAEAQDNLLAAKISQAEFANRHRAAEDVFSIGEKVMLSTEHRRREYIQAKSGRVAKFMPRFDGPFLITKANPSKSSYTLELPNEPNRFPTFHASLLRRPTPNDNDLFPSRQLDRPGPVITDAGEQEWLIDRILDERIRGKGHQYLVRWHGWGAEEDRWLPGRELTDTEALDVWLRR